VASGDQPAKEATDFAEELIEGRPWLWRWLFIIKKSVNQRHQWSFSSAAATSDRRYVGSTCFVFCGVVFALGAGGSFGIVAIGDDE
jgi:hypothetical protein